jgi:hypothetical protein
MRRLPNLRFELDPSLKRLSEVLGVIHEALERTGPAAPAPTTSPNPHPHPDSSPDSSPDLDPAGPPAQPRSGPQEPRT